MNAPSRARATGLAVVALVTATVSAAQPAAGLEHPPPLYVLSPDSGPTGTVVTVSGAGCEDSDFWPGGRDGALAFYNNVDGNFSGAQQTPFDVQADGTFEFTFGVPNTGWLRDGTLLDPLPPGEYLVDISCDSPYDWTTVFTVTTGGTVPPPPELAKAFEHASPQAHKGLGTAAEKIAAARPR